MIAQRTLKNVVRATEWVFTQVIQYLTLRPAPENHGIQFKRIDLDPPVLIRANADGVSQTTLNLSGLARWCPGSTVEHLLSALSGMGIDNALVECNAPELPIMTGVPHPLYSLFNRLVCVSRWRLESIFV